MNDDNIDLIIDKFCENKFRKELMDMENKHITDFVKKNAFVLKREGLKAKVEAELYRKKIRKEIRKLPKEIRNKKLISFVE